MERRDFLFDLMLEDLKSGEPLLQKAALIRMRRMAYVDYAAFVMRFLKDEALAADPRLREAALVLLKEKKEPPAKPLDPAEMEAFGHKPLDALLADWNAADTRIRLAMLAQAPRMDAKSREALFARALEDGNPIIRLEADNLKSGKEAQAVPVDAAKLIEELRATNPPHKIAKSPRDTTVLVVDDSKSVREILATHLEAIFSVSRAANAAEALAQAAATNFDLVFLDVNLPDRDGLDVLAEMRERGATGNIVIFTTLDTPHLIQTAFINGATHYFLKNRLSEMIRDKTLLPELRQLFFA